MNTLEMDSETSSNESDDGGRWTPAPEPRPLSRKKKKEILEYIFSQTCLTVTDISHISETCSHLHQLCKNNEIWRSKFKQKFPWLYAQYHRSTPIDWRAECRLHTEHIGQVYDVLDAASRDYYLKANVSEDAFDGLGTLIDSHPRALWTVVNTLKKLLEDDHSTSNLTRKYYGRLALTFVQHRRLTEEWQQYLRLPEDRRTLQKGATLIAQWYQVTEDISEALITSELDNIADLALEELRTTHPNHPLCKQTAARGLACDAAPPLTVAPGDTRTVLEMINRVLYDKLKYEGNNQNYYHQHNSFINKVLEQQTGIPITLCIVYSEVARRLGVHCQMVNFPGQCILRWHEHPNLPEPSQQYTYIQCFERGRFLTQAQCYEAIHGDAAIGSDQSWFAACDNIQVFQRMCRNLTNIGRQTAHTRGDTAGLYLLVHSVELHLTLRPLETQECIFLIRLYLHLAINYRKALAMLSALDVTSDPATQWQLHSVLAPLRDLVTEQMDAEAAAPRKIEPQSRDHPEELKYSVGMIMKHRSYHYLCVISGWDYRCTAGDQWQTQMGIQQLSRQQAQPFYNVLVADGSNRYAAEDNLLPAPAPTAIPHPEVGKYFTEFCGNHYRPNAQSTEQYPEDLAHTLKILTEPRT